MKLNNPGTWRLHRIMADYCVDRETARRMKAGEDVDIDQVSADTIVHKIADDDEVVTELKEGGE
jgi:hypothetical protein